MSPWKSKMLATGGQDGTGDHREIFHHESRWKHRWRHFWGGGSYLECLPYAVKNPRHGLWRAMSETDQAPHGTSYIMRTGRKTSIVDGIKDKLAGENAVTNLQGKWLECSLLNCVCSATAFSMTGSIGQKRPKSIRAGCWLHLPAASWSCRSVCIPDLLPLIGIWVQAMFRVCSLVTCWCFLTVSVNYILLCQFLPGISQQNGFFFSISINIDMPSLIIFKSLYALLILLDSKASSNEATWLGFTLGQWDPQE